MRKIFNILFVSAALLVFPSLVKGQQLPQFSQYMFNGLHINPGYAGYKSEGYIQSTYRSQWIGLPGAPRTFTVTADLSSNEGMQGFGVSFLSDQIGPARTSGGLFTYAYRLRVGEESFLSFGLSGGFTEYMIDGSLLQYNDKDDPNMPTDRERLVTPNMNAGAFFYTDRFYVGLSAFNMIGREALLREDLSLAFHDFHYYLTAGVLLPLSDVVLFKPSFLVREVKGAPTNYDLNTMFLFMDRLWLGASYRSNVNVWNDHIENSLTSRNALAFILEVYATDNIRVGYAYDHNLNVLQSYRANSHELSVGYYLTPKDKKLKNPRWF